MSTGQFNKVILFDDECILCNRILGFVLKHSAGTKILVSPLKSEFSSKIFKESGLNIDYNSVYYFNNGQLFSKARALQKILSDMDSTGKFLYYLLAPIPNPLINFVYAFIARKRYNIWGKQSCVVNPKIKQHIIYK